MHDWLDEFTATLAGTLALTTPGYTPTISDRFQVITYAAKVCELTQQRVWCLQGFASSQTPLRYRLFRAGALW